MHGDNTTYLDHGVPRKRYVLLLLYSIDGSDPFHSVRISSWAQYNTGLFILDLNKAPWGCGK
jgi:hypothetical protein